MAEHGAWIDRPALNDGRDVEHMHARGHNNTSISGSLGTLSLRFERAAPTCVPALRALPLCFVIAASNNGAAQKVANFNTSMFAMWSRSFTSRTSSALENSQSTFISQNDDMNHAWVSCSILPR